MRKSTISDEERKERQRLAKKKYRESEKGKQAYAKANAKYQQTEKYKEYRKEYYQNNK